MVSHGTQGRNGPLLEIDGNEDAKGAEESVLDSLGT
jgi:hypothetical protein